MPDSLKSAQQVRDRFRSKAHQFDDLYEDERPLVRLLRPGLFRRRRLAFDTVRALPEPSVLDVGCGSGRIAEFVLEAGARRYVGIDFAEPMIDLARARLERHADRVELLVADFLAVELEERFDVILGLGLFDYLPEPERFVARMAQLCAPDGCVVASFPAWSWLKGPIRKVRYEWIGHCPIFDYTGEGITTLFRSHGFERLELLSPSPHGFLLRAWRGSEDPDAAASAT